MLSMTARDYDIQALAVCRLFALRFLQYKTLTKTYTSHMGQTMHYSPIEAQLQGHQLSVPNLVVQEVCGLLCNVLM